MDYVNSLGLAFIAHRLRRLSDRIVDDVGASLAGEGLRVPPRSVSTLLLLAERGPLGPVEIGRALQFSHPLMIRALRTLEQLELIEAVDDPSDQRRRRVRLSGRGRAEADTLARFNRRLESAIGALIAEQGGDADAFLTLLERLTDALAHTPLSTRMTVKEPA